MGKESLLEFSVRGRRMEREWGKLLEGVQLVAKPSVPCGLVKDFLKKVGVELAVSLIVLGILAFGSVLLGDMPVWGALAVAVVVGVVGYVIGTVRSGIKKLYPVYAEHIRDALESLQKVLAGEIAGVNIDEFVERGILGPARYWLRHGPSEDVRLMVVQPNEKDSEQFELLWEAGHSLEAREKFELKIAGSFAGFAYTSGELQWTNDVTNDSRWTPHPKARPSRAYGSLVSVPIRHGNEVVGVLNALSTSKDAFTPGDLKYLEVLASLINVAWGLADEDESGEDREEQPEPAD